MHEDSGYPLRHSVVVDVLRLLLVDDYRMVTEALATRLAKAPDLWVAGSATTYDPKLPELVRWLRPDIIVIDVQPFGFAAGDAITELRDAWPAARIVVVSADEDAGHAVSCARAGADAWVAKTEGADQLEAVLRGVCRGHSWYPPALLGEVLRQLREDVRRATDQHNPLDVLSPRERDVLACLAQGQHGRQIAEELSISPDTVRTHTRSIFGKLEVHTRLEAVRVARTAGLAPRKSLPPAEDGAPEAPTPIRRGRL